MIIDASRGEIQLDDLFNAIENDKDQVKDNVSLFQRKENVPTILRLGESSTRCLRRLFEIKIK